MKDLTKLFLFSILFFSPIISCKNNKDNNNFISAEKTSKNSVENKMITVEEINERLNFNNLEVKEYFKPFYDKLKKMDLEKPTPIVSSLLDDFPKQKSFLYDNPYTFPECSIESLRKRGYRRFLFKKNYVALYLVVDDENKKIVTIMHVFYAKRDYEKLV